MARKVRISSKHRMIYLLERLVVDETCGILRDV